MCFGAFFGLSGHKRKTSRSSPKEKRRSEDGGVEKSMLAERKEPKSTERPRKKRSRESPRYEREDYRPRAMSENVYRSGVQYRPALGVQVPTMWHRSVDSKSTNSSEEMLLNPRPQRSSQSSHDRRQRHPKHTSQSTLRGRGAKRQRSKDVRHDNSGNWPFFASSAPKSQKSRSHYQTLDSSPRSHRSSQQHHSPRHQEDPDSARSRRRHHSSRQPAHPSTRPNTSARRDPDRRFAVLAATNNALEDVRREAFAASPPPPRRERLRRYQGVAIPTSSVPFDWDCISSSQNSARCGEASTWQRRRR